MDNKHIVCLGGGIGTVNLLKGIKQYTKDFTAVISMADDGGSAGRLRRIYNIHPVGDIVSCMAALIDEKQSIIPELLTYRFPGDRYGQDDVLGGHKLGNLILAALIDKTKDFNKAVQEFQKIFAIEGNFLPATVDLVSISAKTSTGQIIEREENIDVGTYEGSISQVFLHPKDAKASDEVINQIYNADIIIAGPGDLYTTILPVLIVPNIKKALLESKAKKIFVVNVANKPHETKGYSVFDYITSIDNHLQAFPFDTVIINNNKSLPIPKQYHYAYVELSEKQRQKIRETYSSLTIIEDDLVKESFPLYHDPEKLANVVFKTV